MSGGVDSSTVAALLLQQGYEVVGITVTSVKITDDCKVEENQSGCCNYQSLIDAADICDQLGIEHHIIDLSEVFKEKIISNFIDEYLHGRTPNPCTICNPLIKWGEILKKADDYDCEYYATGHYAKLAYDETSDRFFIQRAKDRQKDQSYFLWGLSQEQLRRTIFPLGDLLKSEVRKIAKEFNLKVHNKYESQEICFIPSNDYRDVLLQNVDKQSFFQPGDVIFKGVVIGKHRGYPFYTIGQRKGLGISYHQPLYVKEIIPETNTVVVDVEDELATLTLTASRVNFMKFSEIPEGVPFTIKIRYRDNGAEGKCIALNDSNLRIEFSSPRRAITPGQSVVVYDGDDVVCGGIIDSTE